MVARNLSVHGLLFVVASVLAFRSWTAEETPSNKHVGVELWSGKAKDVSKVEFTTTKKHLLLSPQSDKQGVFYVGTVSVLAAAKKADTTDAKPPEPAKPPKRFVSVARGEKLVTALASLEAQRVLGKVEDERLSEFGFDDEAKSVLEVTVHGQIHRLVFGDKTPGGRDRYVREPKSGQAYVIAGSVANDLTTSENRLVERNFHDFGEVVAAQIKLSTNDAGRQIRRHPTEKNFWASVDAPDTKDETLSNWMTKLERLRVTHYVEAPSPAPTDAERVVRVDYATAKGRSLGFLELVKLPPEEGKTNARYLARSERSRWYATVVRSTAEQLEQDLASILTR